MFAHFCLLNTDDVSTKILEPLWEIPKGSELLHDYNDVQGLVDPPDLWVQLHNALNHALGESEQFGGLLLDPHCHLSLLFLPHFVLNYFTKINLYSYSKISYETTPFIFVVSLKVMIIFTVQDWSVLI